MGRAYVVASKWLCDKLYQHPPLRGGIRVVDDKPYEDGNRLLTVDSDDLPHAMSGMRAIVIDGDCARFQEDVDT